MAAEAAMSLLQFWRYLWPLALACVIGIPRNRWKHFVDKIWIERVTDTPKGLQAGRGFNLVRF